MISLIMGQREDIKDLVIHFPDDNSGSMASNRFGYQKNWPIYKLLELESLGRDYMIVMDYHEDVIILDSSTKVENIDFYQLKTKSGDHWTKGELIKSETNKKGEITHSIIGKLLKHSLDFPSARDYYFVTDTFVAGSLLNKGKDFQKAKIPFSKFKPDIQKSIRESIKKEFPGIQDDVWNHFYISQEQLQSDNYKETIIGFLDRFIDQKIPMADIKATTLYDSLFSEMESLQDFEGALTETDILTVKKSFKHSDFQAFIKKLASFESYDRKCDMVIEKYLKMASPEEMSFKRKRNISRVLREKIKAFAYDYNDTEFIQLRNLIANLVRTFDDTELANDDNEWTAANKVLPILNEKYNNYKGFEQDELLALILLEYAG